MREEFIPSWAHSFTQQQYCLSTNLVLGTRLYTKDPGWVSMTAWSCCDERLHFRFQSTLHPPPPCAVPCRLACVDCITWTACPLPSDRVWSMGRGGRQEVRGDRGWGFHSCGFLPAGLQAGRICIPLPKATAPTSPKDKHISPDSSNCFLLLLLQA